MPFGPPLIPDDDFLSLQAALAGRYSLESELGRGGMGLVFRAREVRLDRPVAIKVLKRELAKREAVRQRFLQEARTAAGLYHPNIVPIHLADEAGSHSFFVMACVEGETLARLVERKGPLNPNEAARLLRDLAYALAYAHAHGVVHRDIKPDNILIEHESRRPLVADFGIAQHASTDGSTMAGELIGTPEFMSPEQCAGEVVDSRTDIYSLGIVGYFAISGSLPFSGPDVRGILMRQMTVEPAPLLGQRADVPPRLAAVIHRCLAKEREARFPSGEALAQALDETIDQHMAPIEVRTYLRRFRRPRVEMLLVFGLSAALVVFAIQSAIGGRPAAVDEALMVGGVLGTLFLLLDEFRETRSLMRRGFRHEDVLRVVRSERAEERRELSASMDGPLPDLKVIKRTRAAFLLSCAAVLAVTYAAVRDRPDLPVLRAVERMRPPFLWSFVAAAAAVLGTGLPLAMARARVFGDLGIRVWDSSMARGAFWLASLGIRPASRADPDRPTEVAIGAAVQALIDSLSPTMAGRLQEVANLTPMLEEAAQRLRNRLQHRQDPELEERLAAHVAVLEDFRVGLMRLRADAGDEAVLLAAVRAGRKLLHDAD